MDLGEGSQQTVKKFGILLHHELAIATDAEDLVIFRNAEGLSDCCQDVLLSVSYGKLCSGGVAPNCIGEVLMYFRANDTGLNFECDLMVISVLTEVLDQSITTIQH